MKQRRKKIWRGAVLALAVAGIAAPAAQGKPVGAYTTIGPQTSGTTQTDVQGYSTQALRALTLRSEGMNVRYQPQVVSVRSDGFDWTDAGIGAGVAFGASMVLISGVMVSRRRQAHLSV